ncbi:11913_t:CDS:2 [Entrophospora sp. SA101]|nr:2852_t:CDS:2 [Entrophospora sp. SA101]CAJ0637490.1 11913_t:CDS:2 [Entrophospora sp. SA101]CAJ0859421.1 6521_t:CDS:2 [Entrophospora sp. SA101]CAJ0875795.1 10853_t:CDS:2 [Entrophospora sp. SA101]CAJ0910877.1 9118_t:CDS:2 [Entrophospora sp. SA101]
MTYVNTIFTEGPLEAQALEFAAYVSKLKGEPEGNEPLETKITTLLKENKVEQVFQIFAESTSVLLDAPEKEFEAIYNLLIAILKFAPPETHPSLIRTSVKGLVDVQNDKAIQKLKVLSTSPLRYDVFIAIIDVVTKNDEIEILLPQLSCLDIWVKEWAITTEQVRELYLKISDKLKEAGESYLKTYAQSEDFSAAKQYIIKAVVEAIRLPEILNFQELFDLTTIKLLKDEEGELFELLKIFLSGNLKDYKSLISKNPGILEKFELSNEDSIRKIRLLTLASLASEHVGSEISYEAITKSLEIEESEVEMWIIDVIRANLMEARINQLHKAIFINRSTYRTFTTAEWEKLSNKLEGWKQSLADILQVIANAKLIRQNSNSNANLPTTITNNATVVVTDGANNVNNVQEDIS